MNKTEYEFWEDLQEVTESVGGLFDSQPYEITGNIHHAGDSSIPILGFFSGGSVEEQRIYIDFNELPDHLKKRPYHNCRQDTVCLSRDPNSIHHCGLDIASLPPDPLLVSPLVEDGFPWGYTQTSAGCADCRTQGGTLTKPDFWP